MRDIKFRAWDPQLKKMREVSDLSSINIDGFMQVTVDMAPEAYGFYEMPINHPVLMQFTGLHDKNGKEIYEGDILININQQYEGLKRGPFAIEWGDINNYCGFVARRPTQTVGNMFLARNFTNCEIIGNIYENPELIK